MKAAAFYEYGPAEATCYADIPDPLFRNGWRIVGFRVAPPDDLATSLELIRRGDITVPIAATFPVSDAAAAHRFLEQRQHVGKVLLVAG